MTNTKAVVSELEWPELLLEEYKHFDSVGTCLRVNEFNRVFKRTRFKRRCAPVFFAGNIEQSPFCLVGLNPAYGKENYRKERRIYKKLGWEQTYLTFFDWASREISSRYYSRFAYFLACLLEEENNLSRDTGQRLRWLGTKLVNFNLIPYHSEIFNERVFSVEQAQLLRPYLNLTLGLARLSKRKALFLNGAPFETLHKDLGFELDGPPVQINDDRLAYIGECCDTATIWFNRFLTAMPGASDKELCESAKEIRMRIF